MDFTEQGLVLRVGRFREADLWVRFLSRRRGVLTAFAFGGSRSRRRFSGCLDLFNMLSVSVKSTRSGEYLSLQEATLLRGPDRLRRDIRRCGMATNCLRFVEALGADADLGTSITRFTAYNTVLQKVAPQKSVGLALQCGDNTAVLSEGGGLCCTLGSGQHTLASTVTRSAASVDTSATEFVGPDSNNDLGPLDLALDMLAVLEQAQEINALFPVWFRARYAFSQGYEPRLSHCSHCGCTSEEHERHRFMVREGTMICPDCLTRQGSSGPFVDVTRETLDALLFVQDTSPLKWPQLSLSPPARREFSRLVDGFIQYHIGLTWENGRFRRI